MLGKLVTTMITASLLAASPEEEPQVVPQQITQEISEKALNPFVRNGKYEHMQIAYMGEGKREILRAEDVVEWVRYWPDGHWDIDDDKIAAYVDHLEDVFNTVNRERTFHTTMGEDIVIANGNLGSMISRSDEVKEISKFLRRDRLTSHPIHYSKQMNPSKDTENDYGDSYVEVDLSRQVLWLYEEGRVTLISNIVSGTMNTDRQTPGGMFTITYKQSPAVLRGADYESQVSYWMPFNGNIGLHDATWQETFGGDTVYTNGSHGCINLPLSIAEQIYKRVEKGFPVICYYSNPEDEL